VLKVANPYDLSDKTERASARLARKARCNTIWGGTSALRLAYRMARAGSRVRAVELVSDIYARSTGHASTTWEAWACPECGAACLGVNAAGGHCYEELDVAVDI